MTESIKLDEQQTNAINFLKEHILNKTKVVCLLGAGGTGKTSIIHKLETEDELQNISITYTATTNKAASIMRKDIPEAITMHSAISMYVPTKLFRDFDTYFSYDGINESDGSQMELLKESKDFLNKRSIAIKDLLSEFNDAHEFFKCQGIDSYNPLVFSHYSTAEYLGGVCIVDESSMLPEKSIYRKDQKDGTMKLQTIGLNTLEGIYDTIILVGDDMQLPPINGTSSFEGKPQFHLTKNYRSEKDLLRLLDYARQGNSLELFVPKKGENIRLMNSLPDKLYEDTFNPEIDIAHIVYKNKTRIDITRKIRGSDPQPFDGEPIVYYGANINEPGDNIAKNELGYYKDGYGEWEYHRQVVNAKHFDEYNTNPKVFSIYRYGYALTAHSAQGSSFDYVVVHLGDVPGFIDIKTQKKWCYTAVSRARKGVILVR